MIYIEKEGLPQSVDEKIIKLSKTDEWQEIAPENTIALRQYFDSFFPKDEVKRILIHEQHGICAYCMRRIQLNHRSRIEHLSPLSSDKENVMNYRNLFGVCDGGEKSSDGRVRIISCDASKGETKISISPLDKDQMSRIAYRSDGKIYTDPSDSEMEYDLNITLQLNGVANSDGSFRDTATEVVKGRRDTLARARNIMRELSNRGKCTSAKLEKLIIRLTSQEEYEEYIGVELYYFKKKYNSLIRQGK